MRRFLIWLDARFSNRHVAWFALTFFLAFLPMGISIKYMGYEKTFNEGHSLLIVLVLSALFIPEVFARRDMPGARHVSSTKSGVIIGLSLILYICSILAYQDDRQNYHLYEASGREMKSYQPSNPPYIQYMLLTSAMLLVGYQRFTVGEMEETIEKRLEAVLGCSVKGCQLKK